MSLPVPDSKPSNIEELIAQSVFRFEAKFASFGMLGIARVNGWIEDYRKELVGIATAVRKIDLVRGQAEFEEWLKNEKK